MDFEKIAEDAWNGFADSANYWGNLGGDERESFTQLVRNVYKLGAMEWKDIGDEPPTKEGHYLVYAEGVGGAPDYCDVAYFFMPLPVS